MIGDYIGAPFEEFDCYALIREIYRKEKGIILPNPNIRHNDNYKLWYKFRDEISKNWVRCEEQEGAVVALRYVQEHPQFVSHFGYCIGNGKFIHTLEKTGAILDNLSTYKNIIEGFYIYEPSNNTD